MAKLKIDVNDLHKYYGENEVLKGITAKFYEGDVVCIIGPSGSGKSTFLRSLNLLEEVTSGTITVDAKWGSKSCGKNFFETVHFNTLLIKKWKNNCI